MSRYDLGDTVVILRRFAHLYPAGRGTVVSVDPSHSREMFDQYEVRFHDLTTSTVFDFELIKDASQSNSISATLAFDSSDGSKSPGIRGQESGRQILLRSNQVDVHIRIDEYGVGSRLTGQLLETHRKPFVQNAEVRLWQDETPIEVTTTNSLGEFRFDRVPSGTTTIEVYFHNLLRRLNATISI